MSIEKDDDSCCGLMSWYKTGDPKEDELVDYDSSIREYSFFLHGKNKGACRIFYYCPWCGTKLPDAVPWDEVLEEEYGLTSDDFWDENGNWDESRIPEEFRTDEWWKKRGL